MVLVETKFKFSLHESQDESQVFGYKHRVKRSESAELALSLFRK